MRTPSRTLLLPLAVALASSAACGTDDGDVVPTTTTTATELDVIGLSERPAALVVLDDRADAAARRRFERVLERVGGAVIATLPPRLVIAQVPPGADAALADAGMVARFDRPVDPAELAGATVEEARFLAVYANRWHVPAPRDAIAARRAVLAPGAAWEAPAEVAPITTLRRGPGEEPAPYDPEDQVSVPFAAGTVVVSLLLPESNGAIDRSSEDWTEDRVREIHLKLAAALDQIAAAEPNARLRYVLHLESAPAAGGLDGTIDSDYEFGQRAQWGDWTNESLATAHLLARVLGRPVDPNVDLWQAAVDYQRGLRARYEADAAFFVIVAPNHNFTAGLRAHAYINGPWTVLESNNGAEVFAHELGHIFGALDEYCPDACVAPTAIHGYLGALNANAAFREGDPYVGGIDDGRGEGAPSLMQYNQWGAINGYTRAAWGWLDGDGDGIVDVLDTAPRSELTAEVVGQTVRLTGQVVDRPAMPLWRTPYSVGRIVGLEVELAQGGEVVDVIEVDLPGDTRGRQPVDVTLPPLPAGEWTLRARGVNDVGNREPRGQALAVRIETDANTPPVPHVELPGRALSSAGRHAIAVDAVDLDGDAAEVRVDLGGDGTFDTGWAARWDLEVSPPAGVWAVVVEARDASGTTATRRVEVPVVDGDLPPAVALSPLPGVVHGAALAALEVTADAADPEGGATELSWIAELATDDGEFRLATGWGAGDTQAFALPTPERLDATRVDLAGGDETLRREGWVRDVIALDEHTLAIAAGTAGVWFVDVTGRRPTVISRVEVDTVARDLFRHGDRLYVIGTMLAIVDISDLAAPREVKQLVPTQRTRTATSTDEVPVWEQDGWGASHYLWLEDGERIAHARVRVTVDHPQPAQLRIVLHPPKQFGTGPIVLRDHVAGPGGRRTYTFTPGNVPALADLAGRFAAEGWQLEVVDDVLDGVTGTLVATELRLQTRSLAAPVIRDASTIVGRLSTGELVIGGAGVEVLDVSWPWWVDRVAMVPGTATSDAVLVGDRVVWAGPLESKGSDGPPPVLRGLASIDLSWAWWPEIVRVEDDLGAAPGELARVGSRLYVRMQPVCDEEEPSDPEAPEPKAKCGREDAYTVVGRAHAFAAGAARWELGTTSLRVDRRAFGTNQALWTVGDQGHAQRYDVSDPTDVRVTAAYPQSWASALIPLGTKGEVLLFQGGTDAQIGNLELTESVQSRVYRIAAEARDGAGGVARAYRTVHVIPYDHAPAITAVEQVGDVVGAWLTLRVHAADPDAGAIWDPNLLVRADWDGDGVFDGDWQMWPNQPGQALEIGTVYEAPGTYDVTVEVRDGYWATTRHAVTVVVR